MRLLVHTTHELEQDTLLDNLVAFYQLHFVDPMTQLTIDCRSDTGNQSLIDVVRIDHRFELFDLLRCKRVQESLLVFLAIIEIASDIRGPSLASVFYVTSNPGFGLLSHRHPEPYTPRMPSCTADLGLRDFSAR